MQGYQIPGSRWAFIASGASNDHAAQAFSRQTGMPDNATVLAWPCGFAMTTDGQILRHSCVPDYAQEMYENILRAQGNEIGANGRNAPVRANLTRPRQSQVTTVHVRTASDPNPTALFKANGQYIIEFEGGVRHSHRDLQTLLKENKFNSVDEVEQAGADITGLA